MVKFTGALAMVAAFMLGAPISVQAGDNLLIKRVQQEQGMDLPSRGMTMAQVQTRYGAPQRKLAPRGGDSHRHPLINRWDYSTFIVYFEHEHVIHSVLNTPAGNNHDPTMTQ